MMPINKLIEVVRLEDVPALKEIVSKAANGESVTFGTTNAFLALLERIEGLCVIAEKVDATARREAMKRDIREFCNNMRYNIKLYGPREGREAQLSATDAYERESIAVIDQIMA